MDDADSELTSSTQGVSGFLRIATSGTFGRLHVLPLIPDLLTRHPGLRVDVALSDFVRDMIKDWIDLAIRVGPVNDPEAIVRRIASTPLVCVGSRRYFERHGIPKTPADLAGHNCLVYRGMTESTHWPFVGLDGRFSVSVRGTLTSNSAKRFGLASWLAWESGCSRRFLSSTMCSTRKSWASLRNFCPTAGI